MMPGGGLAIPEVGFQSQLPLRNTRLVVGVFENKSFLYPENSRRPPEGPETKRYLILRVDHGEPLADFHPVLTAVILTDERQNKSLKLIRQGGAAAQRFRCSVCCN